MSASIGNILSNTNLSNYTPLANTTQYYRTQQNINRNNALWKLKIYAPNLQTSSLTTTLSPGLVGSPAYSNALKSSGIYGIVGSGNQSYLYQKGQTTTGVYLNSFTFPVSPMNLNKAFVDLNTVYTVKGPTNSTQINVQRIIDEYGITPVIYTVSGTTGWKYHSNDGYSLTGLQAFHALEIILQQYEQFRQLYIKTNYKAQNLNVILELYDYFNNEFWEIVPVGAQEFSMNASQPLLSFYNLKFIGIKSLKSPTIKKNLLDNSLSQAFHNSISNIKNTYKSFMGNF